MIKTVQVGPNASVTTDMTGLNNLLAGIDDHYVARVGILGNKAHAKHRMEAGELKNSGGHKIGSGQSELTNADIGLRHEKGVKSEHLPRRSWLKDPLEDKLPEYFNKLGSEVIYQMVKSQSLKAYQDLGIICEQIIQKGFETGGYGKWKSLSAFTIANKGSSQILVDTAQFRKSITSTVVTNDSNN